jgi:REP element-mobilizing transposase RayT
MKGHVSKDHVHLLVSLPPQVTISRLMMQWLKGRRRTICWPSFRTAGGDSSRAGARKLK